MFLFFLKFKLHLLLNFIRDFYCIKSIPITTLNRFEKIQNEAKYIFIRKNADYGDAFAEYGLTGVLIRMNDKIKRYITVEKNSINLVKDETLKDTLLDLHNYSALALILFNEV